MWLFNAFIPLKTFCFAVGDRWHCDIDIFNAFIPLKTLFCSWWSVGIFGNFCSKVNLQLIARANCAFFLYSSEHWSYLFPRWFSSIFLVITRLPSNDHIYFMIALTFNRLSELIAHLEVKRNKLWENFHTKSKLFSHEVQNIPTMTSFPCMCLKVGWGFN